jgi:S-adenosylmethionine hydrolase
VSLIFFASDFGPGSEYVGTCHAVIAGIAPATRVIDLTHSLAPFDVAGAAAVLADVLPFAPPAIAVLVVDPGVGSLRRAIALRCNRGDVLVGPDNGLLTTVARMLGGVVEARELNETRYHGVALSSTFHARDIFCPVAAHLSAGVPFERIGSVLDPAGLVAPFRWRLEVAAGCVRCEVSNIDRFGNVRLSAKAEVLTAAGLDECRTFRLALSDGTASVRRVRTYEDLAEGEVGLVEDSFGWLCLVQNRASASEHLRLTRGADVELAG